MYIDKIDELIDSILNDFYYKEIKNNSLLDKIKKDKIFNKYSEKINEMIYKYMEKNDKKLDDMEMTKNNKQFIINIIYRYLAYYVYMWISNYNDNLDEYINNLMEITKSYENNKSKYLIKNFYNSDNNASLIKLYTMIKKIQILVNLKDAEKMANLINKDKSYYDIAVFLNDVGNEFVMEYFIGNSTKELHNIIKTIIFREIYLKQEKTDIYQIIMTSEQEKGEFKFIDIVIPTGSYMDYSMIENVLSTNEIRNGVGNNIYELITEYDTLIDSSITLEKKITELINKRLVIPIVEDFMRYHKDSESYDKNSNEYEKNKIDSLTKISDKERTTKKDNTKIRYIVTKLNKISDLYSKSTINNESLKKDIEKMFYPPLQHRNAVIINEIEEINILNKLEIQGQTAISSNEYYSDLKAYRQYPYINFHNFKNIGFSMKIDKTIDVIRAVNIDVKDNPKYSSLQRSKIQMRVASKDMKINIIGLLIPKNNLDIHCLKLKDIKSVEGNGFNFTSEVLENKYINNKSDAIYWIFDMKTDKLKTKEYEEVNTLNFEDYCKLLVAKLYDNLLDITYRKIKKELKQNPIYINEKIMSKYEKQLINIPPNTDYKLKLKEEIYYDKSIKGTSDFDKNENNIPGLTTDIIKLPKIKEKNDDNEIIIITKNKNDTNNDEIIIENAICQHFITWNNITRLRNKNPNKFNQLFFEFFKKYVIQTKDNDFICKSCSSMLDLRKYVSEYQGGGDTDSFALSLSINIPLEEMAEYEKYNKSIKYIDKLIERIAYISKINLYIGNDPVIKNRRQNMTKEVIDIIILQYKMLQSDYNKRRERGETASKLYGISRDLSSFFLFPLSNDIFIYSSKDIDKYKQIKINNVISYIVFNLITELNINQISSLSYDKVCNYILFEKYGMNLFDGLLIRTNNGDDLVSIKNYKLLCFVLYYFSCIIMKFKVWIYKYDDSKSVINPILQKSIIHTIVELINTILEANTTTEKNYLYDVISTKFFIKLRTVYEDTDVLKRLKKQLDKKVSVDSETKKIKFISRKYDSILLNGQVNYYQGDTYNLSKCNAYMENIKREVTKKIELKNLTKITNCLDGKFHKWNMEKELKCSLCNFSLSKEVYKEKDNQKIESNYEKYKLKQLAKIYCPDGIKHIIDPDTNTCIYCKKNALKIEDSYNDKELANLRNNIKKNIKEESEYIEIKKQKYNIHNIEKQLSPNILDNFIELLESYIGNDINIENKNIYLKSDVYIIDHDHLGNKLKEKIIIKGKDKIGYSKEDNHYKKSVIYYKSKNDLYIYYDAVYLNLLGYKQSNRDYVDIKGGDNYLVIKKSIYHKLKYIGYENKYVDISEEYKENSYNEDKKIIDKIIISSIIRKRIGELKKMIIEIYKIINQVKNKYNGPDASDIVKKYSKIFKNITIENDKEIVFNEWKQLNDYVFIVPLNDIIDINYLKINNEPKYIDIYDVDKMHNNDKLLLYYMISEMIKLIKINDDKFIKINIVYMLIDIIEYVNKIYYSTTYNNDLNRFKHLLTSRDGLTDEKIIEELHLDDTFTEITEEEAEKKKEEDEMNQESIDALDIDIDEDYDTDVDTDMDNINESLNE